MTKAKAEIGIEPVLLNKQQTAALLGISVETFRLALPRLYRDGFPQPDTTFGLYYRGAITAWLDRRHGIGVKIEGKLPLVNYQALENWDK